MSAFEGVSLMILFGTFIIALLGYIDMRHKKQVAPLEKDATYNFLTYTGEPTAVPQYCHGSRVATSAPFYILIITLTRYSFKKNYLIH